jgi:hypothetical protein
MDTDEALARALDEVLSLSGGDPRKGKYFRWPLFLEKINSPAWSNGCAERKVSRFSCRWLPTH